MTMRTLAFSVLAALCGCNAIFGIEPGEPRDPGDPGSGGAGPGSGGAGPGSGGAGPGSGGAGAGNACGEVERPAAPCGTGSNGPATGALRWAIQSTKSAYAQATAVAFGASDDIIVAGTYRHDSIEIGASTLPHAGEYESRDIFLASFARADGKPLWAVSFPAPLDQEVRDIDVAPGSGDIVIAGDFDGEVSFDGGMTEHASNGNDVFVARFTKEGRPLWSTSFQDVYTPGQTEQRLGLDVAFDRSGAIVIGMGVSGQIQFGQETYGAKDHLGFVVGRLDPCGAPLWGVWYPSTFYEVPYLGLDVDADGNIVITGSANGRDFGSADPFSGATDVFVVKLDKNGSRVWSRMFGGGASGADDGHQWGTALAIDCTGDVYVTGAFRKRLVIGDDALTNDAPDAAENDATDDLFVAKLGGADGEPQWAESIADAGVQQGLSVGVDALSNVVIAGTLIDNASSMGIEFAGEVFSPTGPEGSDYREDLFLAKLSPTGEHRWGKRIGNEFIEQGEVEVAPSGEVVVAGDFFFSVQLHAPPRPPLSADVRDMFVATFEP